MGKLLTINWHWKLINLDLIKWRYQTRYLAYVRDLRDIERAKTKGVFDLRGYWEAGGRRGIPYRGTGTGMSEGEDQIAW
jgi:hypothetical protein